MRGFLNLIAALCLVTGLTVGSVVHATQIAGSSEVTTATAWLHAADDHDQASADPAKSVPHHHNICHGDDLGTPMNLGTIGAGTRRVDLPKPLPGSPRAGDRKLSLLRPPMA